MKTAKVSLIKTYPYMVYYTTLILLTTAVIATWFIAEGDTKMHTQTGCAGIPQPSVGRKHY